MSLRIDIDLDRCSGHGRCYMLAPDVFDADDEGWPVTIDNPAISAEEHAAEARTAVGSCPESAITVTEAPAAGQAG